MRSITMSKVVINGWLARSIEQPDGTQVQDAIVNYQVVIDGDVATVDVNGSTDQLVVAKLLQPLLSVVQIVFPSESGADQSS